MQKSLWKDYVWANAVETLNDAKKLTENGITGCDTVKPHSCIEYLASGLFESELSGKDEIRDKFLKTGKVKSKRC